MIQTKKPTDYRNNLLPKDRYTTIYALINPINCKVFYVGSTYQPLRDRLNHHISLSLQNSGQNAKRNLEIFGILSKGKRPIIQELEVCTGYVAPTIAEKFWIYQYGCVLGKSITNGRPHSEFLLTRKRVSKWSAKKKALLSQNQ